MLASVWPVTISTGDPRGPTDPGPRCICGHSQHTVRCPCGCRTYVSAGSHPDQSRGGAIPAVIALVAFVVLVGAAVAVIVVRALW